MIIANWKMNGTKELIEEWIDSVSQNIHINKEKDCVFCPPTCYLDFAGSLIEQRFKDLKLGSQQVDSELSLPLTGGINSKMLVDLGCQFVIVGHSEQRMHLKENNQILSDKLKTATDNNLRPIFCIGESLQQKRANQTQNILKEQLSAIYEDILE